MWSSREVHHAVGKYDPDVYVGVGLKKRHYHGEDVQASEDDRCSDDQVAFGRTIFACRSALRLSNLLEDAFAIRNVGPPRVG